MLNPLLSASALLMLLAAPAAAPDAAPPSWDEIAQQAQNLVVHVPRVTITRTTVITRSLPIPTPPLPAPTAMVERKADDCVKMENIRGFSVNRPDSVDLMLKSGKLLRVKLGKDCPALGFYSGFYVKANADKKMCAGRDSIRSRSGRLCNVEAFKSLVPAN
jgi:hypothetical protein